MRAGFVTAAVALLPLAAGGCSYGAGGSRPPIPGDKIQLEIQDRKLDAEVVFTDRSRRVGLMFREHLPEDSGMLFIYPEPDRLRFWMRNTEIPLSIAFLSDEGEILEIRDMKPKDESGTESKHRVRYALEVNQGWCRRAGVGVGDRFRDFHEKVQRFPVR